MADKKKSYDSQLWQGKEGVKKEFLVHKCPQRMLLMKHEHETPVVFKSNQKAELRTSSSVLWLKKKKTDLPKIMFT